MNHETENDTDKDRRSDERRSREDRRNYAELVDFERRRKDTRRSGPRRTDESTDS